MHFRNVLIVYFLTIACKKEGGKFRWRYWYIYHSRPTYSSNESPPPAPPPLPPATQQDKDDANKIANDQFSEETIASIFSNRTLDHRKVINDQIAFTSQIINNQIVYKNQGKRLIELNYLPNHSKNPPFKDLCFALVNDPITVLAMYLGEFLHRKDETFIMISLTLCQQMNQLHYIYNQKHKNSLTKRREKQRHPFANLMKVWLDGDREPDDNCKVVDDDVIKIGEGLKEEYPHWKEERDGLEQILMKKCLKFGAAAIKKFEDDLKLPIEDAIKQKVKNHDLVDAYLSLVHYVKDKYGYMAKLLLDHSDRTDRWAVWIMLVGFITGDDWPKIDAAFGKINNNVTLRDHILNNSEPDKVLLGLMAAMIDPKDKPIPY